MMGMFLVRLLSYITNPDRKSSVSTSLAQKYLSDITRVALGTTDHYAMTAVDCIVSICRQGLVHPKEVSAPYNRLTT